MFISENLIMVAFDSFTENYDFDFFYRLLEDTKALSYLSFYTKYSKTMLCYLNSRQTLADASWPEFFLENNSFSFGKNLKGNVPM